MTSRNPDDPTPPQPTLTDLLVLLSELHALLKLTSALLQHWTTTQDTIERRLYGLQQAYANAGDYIIAQRRIGKLTRREAEVLWLLARGMNNRQIGQELGISAGTAKNHVTSILSKFSVSSRQEAVAWAQVLGLI